MAFRRPSGNTPPFPNIYSQNQSLQQQQPTPLSGHPPAPLPHPPHVLSTSSAQNTLSKSMTDASNTTASPTLRNKRPRPADMHAPDTPTSATANAQPTDDGFIADADAGESGADDDEEEGTGKPADKKAGRRKIKIEFIQDKSRRHITFSKRKAGQCSVSLFSSLRDPDGFHFEKRAYLNPVSMLYHVQTTVVRIHCSPTWFNLRLRIIFLVIPFIFYSIFPVCFFRRFVSHPTLWGMFFLVFLSATSGVDSYQHQRQQQHHVNQRVYSYSQPQNILSIC